MPERRVLVEADPRGRVSLAKLGIKNTQMIAERFDDGVIVLHPAVVMTEAEMRHYSDPTAVAALNEALAAADRGETRAFTLRSE